jgi:hypothetical protein
MDKAFRETQGLNFRFQVSGARVQVSGARERAQLAGFASNAF